MKFAYTCSSGQTSQIQCVLSEVKTTGSNPWQARLYNTVRERRLCFQMLPLCLSCPVIKNRPRDTCASALYICLETTLRPSHVFCPMHSSFLFRFAKQEMNKLLHRSGTFWILSPVTYTESTLGGNLWTVGSKGDSTKQNLYECLNRHLTTETWRTKAIQ